MNEKTTKQIRAEFLNSEGGNIFALGCCMLIIWVAVSVYFWQSNSDLWLKMLTLGFAHMVAGKGVSIAQGIQSGLPSALIVVLASYADMMAMCIIYPVLIFSYENFLENHFFQKHMRPVFDSARKRMSRMRKYKIMGVYLFVWLPFWMTGVIVGAVLGFLLGLRNWVVLLTVALGTTTSIICWVYAYDRLFAWLGWIREGIPGATIAIALVALVILRIARKRRVIAEGLRKRFD